MRAEGIDLENTEPVSEQKHGNKRKERESESPRLVDLMGGDGMKETKHKLESKVK
jgi:hypothetical protein